MSSMLPRQEQLQMLGLFERTTSSWALSDELLTRRMFPFSVASLVLALQIFTLI